MARCVKSFFLLAAVTAVVSLAVAGDAEYHNCTICKPLMAAEGLMDHMKWESHEIATGMISVTTVDADYRATYDRAHQKMMEGVEKAMGDETLPLCPFCKSMNKLARAGAQFQNIKADGAYILAVTSEEPAVIEQIHAHVKHQQEEHGG